jgi:hypothetical protein
MSVAAPARGLMECQVMFRTRLRRLVLTGALAAAAAGLGGCYAYPVGYAGYDSYGYNNYAYVPASRPTYYGYTRYYSYPRYYGGYPRYYGGYPRYYGGYPRYYGGYGYRSGYTIWDDDDERGGSRR